MRFLKTSLISAIIFLLSATFIHAEGINKDNYNETYVYGCGKKMKVLANRYTNKVEYVWSKEESSWKSAAESQDCINEVQSNYTATD